MEIKQVFFLQTTNEQLSKRDSAAGFTLLETLISLAILSVVSLALFQSTSMLLHITDRAVFAGGRALESSIARKTFRSSIGGLTLAWREHEGEVFIGKQDSLSGLSRDVPALFAQRLQHVSFHLIPRDTDTIVLEVKTEDTAWDLHEFTAQSAKFSYLGADQRWYEAWPPEQTPSTGFFDDAAYIQTPQLPLAVRISGVNKGEKFTWIANISDVHRPLYREEL